MTDDRTTRIRALNDCLRCTGVGGQVVITRGIQALGPEKLRAVIAAVTSFEAFSEDNDPHGEHDFVVLNSDAGSGVLANRRYGAPIRVAGGSLDTCFFALGIDYPWP